MDFLPKDIEDIILDYKLDLDFDCEKHFFLHDRCMHFIRNYPSSKHWYQRSIDIINLTNGLIDNIIIVKYFILVKISFILSCIIIYLMSFFAKLETSSLLYIIFQIFIIIILSMFVILDVKNYFEKIFMIKRNISYIKVTSKFINTSTKIYSKKLLEKQK